jgi:hypothetical protein
MSHETRITEIERLIPTLATKMDMAELRQNFAEFRADVADIRTDIHKAITENARWTHNAAIGMFSAFIVGVGGLLYTISIGSKSPPPTVTPIPSTTTAPIVITIPQSAMSASVPAAGNASVAK